MTLASAAGFETFAEQLLANNPILRSLSWIAKVADAERENFERQLQLPGPATFFIKEKKPDGTVVAAPRRDAYSPISFIAPLLPHLSLAGARLFHRKADAS